MYTCHTYYQPSTITIAYDAHGALGGASTWARGGNFSIGFASGAVASSIASCTEDLVDKLPTGWKITCMVAAGGLSGGVTASMAGGSFWDGVCNGLICSGLNHALHMIAGPDDPPDKQTNKAAEKTQNATNKIGTGITLFDGALKISCEATGGLDDIFKTIARVGNILTGVAIGVNAVGNYIRYDSGEITLYSMFARDAMTLIEFGVSKVSYGIGVIPSIALTAYDIGGGFEQTIYNEAWVKTQIHNWDQHLYQYRPDPGYQPIYYRHGK